MRPNVIEIVRSGADDQYCYLAPCDVLLISNVLIYCDENIKVFFCKSKQFTILFAAESRVSNGLALMPALGKKKFPSARHALVKQQSHFKFAVKLIRASSRAAIASARVTLGKSSRNSLRLRSCSK